MPWACGAEMPLPPYLAKGSCFVPKGQLWHPSGCLSVPPWRLPPAGWLLPPAQWVCWPNTRHLCWLSDPQTKPGSKGGFPCCWVVVQCCRISVHDQADCCFPRNGKLNRPSVSDAGRRGGNHWLGSCHDGSSNFASNELACAFSSSRPRQVPRILKDPARFPTEAHASQWLKQLLGMQRCTIALMIQVKNLPEPVHREVLCLCTSKHVLHATLILLSWVSESVFHVT